jgi:phosphomannomutase
MSIFDQSIFRAYDMRGTYPNHMNEEVAYAAGQAFVAVMEAKTVVVGRDVRSTGVGLANALIQGVIDAGANVIEIGVISTEMLYYAAANLECDGGMSVTASHNPAQWNGIKFIGKGAEPLTRDGKLGDIYEFMQASKKLSQFEKGTVTHQDMLPGYTNFLKEKYSPTDLPQLKIVANANFGANGKVVDAAIAGLPLDMIRLNWNEDGSFPKGTPDPMLPSNRQEIIDRVIAEGAHFGVAWDADADRCFFYDEKGRFFHGYYITALLIKHFLQMQSGQSIVVERRLTWANAKAVEEGMGKLVYSRTGHGYIKQAMRANDAVFGGESSGHYYYKDFWFCDSGLVTFMIVMGMFAKEIKEGRSVSGLLDYYMENFPIILEEQNYITPKADEIIKFCAEKYADAEQNHEDGLTIEYQDWRFNLRMSSNEPVLRLNMEARSQEVLAARHAEIAGIIAEFGATLRDDHA